MKFISNIKALSVISLMFVLFCCSSDDSSQGATTPTPTPEIVLTGVVAPFAETDVLSFSDSQSVQVKGMNLTANLIIETDSNFQISLDDTTFSANLTIDKADANSGNQTVYVRFAPAETAVGPNNGVLTFKSGGATSRNLNLSGVGVSITPIITVSEDVLDFGEVANATPSEPLTLNVNGDNLVNNISLSTDGSFEISLDNVSYGTSLQIDAANANDDTMVYVRYTPSEVGVELGLITLQNALTDDVNVDLKGFGLPVVHNYVAFSSEHLAFGGGLSQSSEQTVTLHDDISNIETINMYVQLDCPSGGCDAWDVFANISVRDEDSNDWYEIGRYITPYGVDNNDLDRGFMIDVTDFKSLLIGELELRAYIEVWGSDGWNLSVDFDYIEGTPDYPYYAIAEVLQYNENSLEGVIYGEDDSAFVLAKSISVPANAESTHLRTIITGWGHATPNDSDGRPCAEWCFRTHDVVIDNVDMFQHDLGPIGCASNPVSPQNGNWQPDRAGWCPGMAVPVRIDEFDTAMAGNTFGFKYDFEDWTNDLQSTASNIHAYYAISTFVIVKSDTPIAKPNVTL